MSSTTSPSTQRPIRRDTLPRRFDAHVALRIESDQLAALDDLALRRGRSRGHVIRDAVDLFLRASGEVVR